MQNSIGKRVCRNSGLDYDSRKNNEALPLITDENKYSSSALDTLIGTAAGCVFLFGFLCFYVLEFYRLLA